MLHIVRLSLRYEAHLPGIPGTGVKTGSIIARHVPFTTHQIVDVLAERRCRRRVSTTAEAKLVESDEILTCEKEIDQLSQ
jgi:ribosomal protein S13